MLITKDNMVYSIERDMSLNVETDRQEAYVQDTHTI